MPPLLRWRSLLLDCLLGSLGLDAGDFLLGDGLDDVDSNGLPHVTDGELTERGEIGEGFHAHWLGGFQANNAGVAGLDEFGFGFGSFTCV